MVDCFTHCNQATFDLCKEFCLAIIWTCKSGRFRCIWLHTPRKSGPRSRGLLVYAVPFWAPFDAGFGTFCPGNEHCTVDSSTPNSHQGTEWVPFVPLRSRVCPHLQSHLVPRSASSQHMPWPCAMPCISGCLSSSYIPSKTALWQYNKLSHKTFIHWDAVLKDDQKRWKSISVMKVAWRIKEKQAIYNIKWSCGRNCKIKKRTQPSV